MGNKPTKVWTDKGAKGKTKAEKPLLDLAYICPKYTPDHELKDTPSRLFRRLLRDLNLNTAELGMLIEDYLTWEIIYTDPVKGKHLKASSRGNIKSGYFAADTMTMSKFIGGLSILKAKRCTITVEVEFHDRPTVEVSETVKIHSAYDDVK